MKPFRQLALIMLLTAATSACSDDTSEEQRRYEIPQTLCDTQVERHLLAPLFPAGEQLEILDHYDDSNSGRLTPNGQCIVEVDGTPSIYIESDAASSALSEKPGVAHYLSTYLDGSGNQGTYSTSGAERVAESPRETWVWPDMAATSVLCESSSVGFSAVNVSVRLDWVGDENYSQQLGDVITPFATELLKRIGERTCTPATARG